MSDHNSYASLIKGLYGAILVDCAEAYPQLAKEFRRDLKRLDSAIDCHGVGFALITMPAFGKHLDQCLSKGRLTPSGLNNFGALKDSPVPRLFRGLVLRVFDRQGNLLPDPDRQAVRYVRQLLGVGKRMRMTCSDIDKRKAVEQMVETDALVAPSNHDWLVEWPEDEEKEISEQSFADLPVFQPLPLFSLAGLDVTGFGEFAKTYPGLLQDVQLTADIISATLGSFDPTKWRNKQGPGAVSDNQKGAYKYDFLWWPERLETAFPYDLFALANWSCGSVNAPWGVGGQREKAARLIAVPKVLDKPRLIASEPVSHQWCQQTIRSYFYERTRLTLLGGFVDYANQTLSGDLALKASIDGSLSTVDLSEASDRISLPVVERLFRKNSSLLRALRASRSAFMEIPSDLHKSAPRVVKLRKYSTMGNATTFPVQSTLFTVLALACTMHVDHQKPSIRSIQELRGQVRVFGDDIVIPTRAVRVLLELLPALGLKVNVHKTFCDGNFRESCGVDAFMGVNVAPVRVLDVPDKARPGTIVSTVDVHNNLLDWGLPTAAAYLRKRVPPQIERSIPEVSHGSGCFGFATYGVPDNSRLKSRWSTTLSVRQRLCFHLKVKTETLEPKTSAGLLQFFTELSGVITSATSSIGWLASRPKIKLRLGWVSVG